MAASLGNFRRASVVEQAADLLAQAIEQGDLPDPLPGEFQLAEKLKISRPTLRRALAILEKRGLLRTARGKRTRLVAQEAEADAAQSADSTCDRRRPDAVCFIASALYHPSTLLMTPIFSELKLQLTAEGIPWEAIYESKLSDRTATSRLAEITGSRRKTCYVLFSPPKPLQQWFMKSGLPVLILGSCYDGIELPSIDLDYRAVGWHAAGQLIKNGHRRILLVRPSWAHPVGNAITEQAVRDYLAGTERGADLRILQASTHPDEFLPALKRAITGPKAPTALLACRVEIALSLLGSAPLFGKSIPGDLSLISRDHYPILDTLTPRITHYATNFPSIARKAVRSIRALLQGVPLRKKTVLITPEFIPGQTLRPLP